MTTIVATTGTNEYPKVPTGVHNARCVRVIDLGTQRNDYGGNITYKRQVLIILKETCVREEGGLLRCEAVTPLKLLRAAGRMTRSAGGN